LLLISCVVAPLLLPLNATGAEIRVLGGSGVIAPMNILIPNFERETANKVLADFDGAIGAMTKRVDMGERADVVIVSRRQIDSLEKNGKVVAGTAKDIGRVGIGVFVRRGAPKPDLSTVESFKRAMLAAESIGYNDPAAGAPVSIYLLGLFKRLGIAKQMAEKTVAFKRRSDRFEPVARGDVQIGFNQISEILAVPNVELAGPLPAEIQNYTVFTAAVLTSSGSVETARAFVSFISSPAAFQIMKSRGFE
jgi:molybdate transport system substrate-binding protein